MKPLTLSLCAASLLLATGFAIAQPGVGCPGPMMRGGRGPGARWGQGWTPGWSMMTDAERQQHRDKLAALKTYDECHAYMTEHHDLMVTRAKDKGAAMPAQPRRDACAGLKPPAPDKPASK